MRAWVLARLSVGLRLGLGLGSVKMCGRIVSLGSESFIVKLKSLSGFKAKGRDVIVGDEGYLLQKEAVPYIALFRAEKDDIGHGNTYSFGHKH
jgi:hypothetical protein